MTTLAPRPPAPLAADLHEVLRRADARRDLGPAGRGALVTGVLLAHGALAWGQIGRAHV